VVKENENEMGIVGKLAW